MHTFEEPRLTALKPGELTLEVPVLNDMKTETILVGAHWKVFRPLVRAEIEPDTIRVSRIDGKALDVVRVTDDDTFTKPTKEHPVFTSNLTEFILKKCDTTDTWTIALDNDTQIADMAGFAGFREFFAAEATKEQQKQLELR